VRRSAHIAVEQGDQPVRRVTELADVQIIEVGVVVGAAGDRGATERGRLPESMGALVDVENLPTLDVHAADENGIRPGELRILRRTDVLVDEAHVPRPRQIGGDNENALRRHEGENPPFDWVGVLERAE